MNADQLSQSAAFIAIKFYGLTRNPDFRGLFDEETIRFYESIVQTLPRPLSYYHYWLQFDWIRALYIKSEELLLPGDLMHILARKWYISKMLDELLNQGYQQLLVLGAGFDHTAYYYRQRGIPALELDSPRMAKLKKDFFQEVYPSYPHPSILAAQLPEHSLSDILENQETIAPQEKTAIISEGFFDYLTSQEVSNVLSTLHNYFIQPALLSTHFALDELPPHHRLVFRSSLNLVGEKLQFDTSMSDFKSHLLKHGFMIDRCYRPEEMADQFVAPLDTKLDILNGFYIISAKGSLPSL
ncbi:class I SAM-dependent methyltransferase [Fodinibius salsisoli]|uniref:Class I SAM-dependent methyltransferase n=1 Tax=Fodinibius salsisoli TaxID=2820877 RepID=A0ABT3PKG4_9BACT|nr:class I SAM-dependent methyltransferase [Fodinibius salsisoli]MCW9706430.1 class I SAM-dependent methyltransferase [Fodinibius salsisoli]